MSICFIASSDSAVPALVEHAPDDPAITYSDYCTLAVSGAAATFSRPTADGYSFQHTNPGARVRFSTDSAIVLVRLQWTNLLTTVLYEPVGAVLVDGVLQQTFTRAAGAAGPTNVYMNFGGSASRTIEVVMPYAASVEFRSVSIQAGATLTAAAPRPATRYVAVGDSISHGFFSSDVLHSWVYKLSVAKVWQTINHGYGGRQCVPADGATLGALMPSVSTYLIGYNDFFAQRALAAFKADYIAFLGAFRAINTTAKLYCLTPIYTTSVAAIPIEDYRQQIRDALTEVGGALDVLVEGPTLMTNDPSRLTDGIHPNDTGAAEIAASLAGLVSV